MSSSPLGSVPFRSVNTASRIVAMRNIERKRTSCAVAAGAQTQLEADEIRLLQGCGLRLRLRQHLPDLVDGLADNSASARRSDRHCSPISSWLLTVRRAPHVDALTAKAPPTHAASPSAKPAVNRRYVHLCLSEIARLFSSPNALGRDLLNTLSKSKSRDLRK